MKAARKIIGGDPCAISQPKQTRPRSCSRVQVDTVGFYFQEGSDSDRRVIDRECAYTVHLAPFDRDDFMQFAERAHSGDLRAQCLQLLRPRPKNFDRNSPLMVKALAELDAAFSIAARRDF